MNEIFFNKVYPAMLHTLGVLDRISSRTSEPTPAEVMPTLKQYLSHLDGGAGNREMELAKCALAYWMDEVLINSDWSHAKTWKDNTLERDLFDGRDRAYEFFEKAKVAKSLGRTDALETFYLCVALGFKGLYRQGGDTGSSTSVTPPPSPAPAPKSKASPPRFGAESVSWFGDQDMFAGKSTEDSWGIGGSFGGAAKAEVPLPGDSGIAPKKSASDPPAPGRGTQGTARDLPRTLKEWAQPVFSQIVPGAMRTFVPGNSPESQREARPLTGWRGFQRAIAGLFWMCAVTFGLFLWWLARG